MCFGFVPHHFSDFAHTLFIESGFKHKKRMFVLFLAFLVSLHCLEKVPLVQIMQPYFKSVCFTGFIINFNRLILKFAWIARKVILGISMTVCL